MVRPRPLVGILANRGEQPGRGGHAHLEDVVVQQVARHAGVTPVLLPPGDLDGVGGLLRALDGLVLPGSVSFVHPASRPAGTTAAGAAAARPDREYDRVRDRTAFALLTAAEAEPGLPVLGSCRGLQEMGVHAGARLGEVDDPDLHRVVPDAPGGDPWRPAHALEILPGGLLAALLPDGGPAVVNSQHCQALVELPPRVRVEAVAPDGVVEAISLDAPGRFVLGVQWHVERHTEGSPLDLAILRGFGDRCRHRVARRGR